MTFISNSSNVQLAGPTTVRLANDFEITIVGGILCAKCAGSLRACDAEAIDERATMRLVCRHCGLLIFKYEPVSP